LGKNAMIELSIAQWLGLLSFALGIASFYQRDDKKLKILMLVLQLNNVLSVARTGFAIRIRSRRLAYAFIALSFIVGWMIGDTWTDIFPILGTSMGTYAMFCLSGIRMRVAFLMGSAFWLTNNIIVGSIGGTLLEMTIVIVNLNTIRRLYKSQIDKSQIYNRPK
jgi:hypothetical protein